MTRGHLPKAYLRVDPNIDQTHPDNLDGYLRLLCAANRQAKRGRFRSRRALDSLFGKRAVDRLYGRGDVIDQDDGTVLVPGWDQWQEGDLTVGERMSRLREGRSPGANRTANWRLRSRVFERDKFTCRYCGIADYDRRFLVAEHVIPQPEGPTTIENLVDLLPTLQ